MAYKEEITKKFFEAEKISTHLPWKLFIFSFIVFAGSLVLYFGLILGYGSYLKTRVDTVKKQIDRMGGKISFQEKENILNLYSQLTNISALLDQHIKGSNFFSFMEEKTLPDIYFFKGQFNLRDKAIILEGNAPSYKALAQQIKAFKESPLIKNVNLQDSFRKGEGISFSLLLSFDKNLFKFKNK